MFQVKRLVPVRQRQQLRVALARRHYKLPLRKVLEEVRLGYIGEVLSCCEDFEHRRPGRTAIWPRRVPFPIQLRNGTSDFAVFRQVFLEQQYNLPAAHSAEFIIDAGANIGLASAYFLSINPMASVVAIEPDLENYTLAIENLKPFGARCRLIHGALWSRSGTVGVSRGTFRDGGHWATQTVVNVEGCSEEVRRLYR